jgi:hypothetical protein
MRAQTVVGLHIQLSAILTGTSENVMDRRILTNSFHENPFSRTRIVSHLLQTDGQNNFNYHVSGW